MFSARWCEATWQKRLRQGKFSLFFSVFFSVEFEKLHIYNTFLNNSERFSPSATCKNFSNVWFYFTFPSEISQVSARVCSNQLARAVKTQRNCSKTPKSCAIKQMVNATKYTIALWTHLGVCLALKKLEWSLATLLSCLAASRVHP